MRKCPFCDQNVKFCMPHLLQLSDGTWSYMHHCNLNMSIMITAESKEKILENWEGGYGEEHSAEQ